MKVVYAIVATLMLGFVSPTARVEFEPLELTLTRDSTGFVTALVNVRNVGTTPLEITSVSASCGCSGASVQQRFAEVDSAGRIYLWINAKKFTDSVNYVDFTVTSNAENSPSVFRVTVLLQEDER